MGTVAGLDATGLRYTGDRHWTVTAPGDAKVPGRVVGAGRVKAGRADRCRQQMGVTGRVRAPAGMVVCVCAAMP